MLSEDLTILAGWLSAYDETGLTLDARGVEALRSLLYTFAGHAAALERPPVLSPDVVRLAEVLARKGVRVGCDEQANG